MISKAKLVTTLVIFQIYMLQVFRHRYFSQNPVVFTCEVLVVLRKHLFVCWQNKREWGKEEAFVSSLLKKLRPEEVASWERLPFLVVRGYYYVVIIMESFDSSP